MANSPSIELFPPPAAGVSGPNQENPNKTAQEESIRKWSKKKYTLLVVMNYALLFSGSISSTLLSKYYFIHKGSSKWVSTFVQSAGFPLLLAPIYLPFILGCTERRPFTGLTRRLLLLSASVGLLLGVNNLLFSFGNSYLPVSTFSLLLSSQLAFNLILSFLIVNQKLNFLNINCVVLLSMSSVLLALSSSSHESHLPPGEHFWAGFFSTLGAGLLFALYLPVMEAVYRRVDCYGMVVEMQLVMEAAATAFAGAGMWGGGGFADMRAESRGGFDKGPAVYWVTICGNMVVWQLCFVGTAGMVFLTTSLTGGICMTGLMAANVVGGVVVYGDEFGGVKAVAAVICVWGFSSYLYGMYVKNKNKDDIERDAAAAAV
ncbi:purine permease-related family protein [Striga asiatica]|uniref:Probable purine permease n=1 Tax=Striga asiatica TaxID=4170 RepID=A0A5A7PF85_STRAF|nr:purine permease-related family protein [Striga asiatica]